MSWTYLNHLRHFAVQCVPVHQCLGPRRSELAAGGRHRHFREPGPGSMGNSKPPRTYPPLAPPQLHDPRPAAPDADGFTLVQSRRRRRRHRHALPHPRRQRPVPPSLVGLCFNCLAGDHIATRCTFPSRCLLCLSTTGEELQAWSSALAPPLGSDARASKVQSCCFATAPTWRT
jgi:hypothetical protein